jgi:hypothetical protein
MKWPRDDAAESGTALASSMMEPIALTQRLLRLPRRQVHCGRVAAHLNRITQGLARTNRVSFAILYCVVPSVCRAASSFGISLQPAS